jgi:nuclear GTP-binding protein
MSLLTDSTDIAKMNLTETEAFSQTFGPKAQRKRPKIAASTMEELSETIDKIHGM